jgi:hypothetical protein
VPIYADLFEWNLQAQAALRCAGVAVAVERFRQQHGRWPENLAEIPPEILPKVPTDPFTEDPLQYVVRSDGGVSVRVSANIYRGEAKSPPNSPVGPAVVQANPIRFRLYKPEQRGLPPIPKEEKDKKVGERGPEPREVEP